MSLIGYTQGAKFKNSQNFLLKARKFVIGIIVLGIVYISSDNI